MNQTTTENVIEVLESKGRYRRTSEPLHVADADFQFDAVLVGPGDEQLLVLVVNSEGGSLRVIQARIAALSAMLERTKSTRPIALVLVGADLQDPAVVLLENLCRVILVQTDDSPEKCLQTLLPLGLPEPYDATVSAEAALNEELGSRRQEPLVDKLIKAAKAGGTEVTTAMRQAIDRAAKSASSEEEENRD